MQVHSSCKDQMGKSCSLGQCKVSIIPPTAINSVDTDGERPGVTCIAFISQAEGVVLTMPCAATQGFGKPPTHPVPAHCWCW